MNHLRKIVRDYVTMRRHLGYKLRRTPVLLNDFVGFLRKQQADYITVSLALQWAQSKSKAPREEWAKRLSCVRCFARHLSAIDGRTQIPPWGLMPFRFKRARPYLYTDHELQTLLRAAVRIGGLQGQTYYCLIGLLSVSALADWGSPEPAHERRGPGCRSSGYCRSQIRQVSFGAHSRYDTKGAGTLQAPARQNISARSTVFLRVPRGCRLDESGVEDKFRRLTEEIGLRIQMPGEGRVCMILGTGSLSRHCWLGIVQVRTLEGVCQFCPLTWAMCMSATLTGISAPVRKSWRWHCGG